MGVIVFGADKMSQKLSKHRLPRLTPAGEIVSLSACSFSREMLSPEERKAV